MQLEVLRLERRETTHEPGLDRIDWLGFRRRVRRSFMESSAMKSDALSTVVVGSPVNIKMQMY